MRLHPALISALALIVTSSAHAAFPIHASRAPAGAVEIRQRVETLDVGLGISSQAYEEAGLQSLSQTSLTAKLAYERKLGGNWVAGANTFITALPFGANLPQAARFLGANLRGGYVFPRAGAWQASVLGGIYYTTMFVPNDAYGYRNLAWPQLYPTVSRDLGAHGTATAYLKLSPLADGFSFDFAQHELAGGVSWSRPLEGGNRMVLGVDAASLRARLSSKDIRSTNFTFSAGYGW